MVRALSPSKNDRLSIPDGTNLTQCEEMIDNNQIKSGTRWENRNAPDSLELSLGFADLIRDIYDFKFHLGRSPEINSQIADLLGFFRHMKTRFSLRMTFVSFQLSQSLRFTAEISYLVINI